MSEDGKFITQSHMAANQFGSVSEDSEKDGAR